MREKPFFEIQEFQIFVSMFIKPYKFLREKGDELCPSIYMAL